MRKFINHIDHVTWISRPENLEANVAALSKLLGVQFDAPCVRTDLGFTIYMCWEAGLEIVSPLAEETDFNKALHERLATHGEGLFSVIFGVNDLQAARERALSLGYSPGETMGKNPDAPWAHKLVDINEVMAGTVLNTWVLFGDITYADGVVQAE